MIHVGDHNCQSDDPKQQKSFIEQVEKQTDLAVEIFAERLSKGKFYNKTAIPAIKKNIYKKYEQKIDWWLLAEEAIEYGFADGILGSDEYSTVEDIRNAMLNEGEE